MDKPISSERNVPQLDRTCQTVAARPQGGPALRVRQIGDLARSSYAPEALLRVAMSVSIASSAAARGSESRWI